MHSAQSIYANDEEKPNDNCILGHSTTHAPPFVVAHKPDNNIS